MAHHLLPVQRAYLQKQTEGKTEAMKDASRECDKKFHAELNVLRSRTCNAECFDCTAKKPGWAVLPHGVFVCIDCAQVHRSMGRHVSQTKAINTGTYLWFPHELAVMRAVGNGTASRAFGAAAVAAKPSRDAAPEVKQAYARRKYVEHFYGLPQYEAVTTAVPRAPAAACEPAVTTAVSAAPIVAQRPNPAKAMGFDDDLDGRVPLINLVNVPPVAPAASAAPASAVAAQVSATPGRAAGCNTNEIIRLFDPLPPLTLPPSKPAASSSDAFFATFGL